MTACALCGLPTPDAPVTDPAVEGGYCCPGCLAVARALGGRDVDGGDDAEPALDAVRRAVSTPSNASEPADDPGPTEARDGGETAVLAVDGMHCATCEAFLEARAAGHEGVASASASYPSSLLRVTYDPAAVDRDALPDLVSGLGYRARPASAAEPGGDTESVGRLLVGGFFGMMVMLWYVLFLYPTYLGLPAELLLFDLAGPAAPYLFGNVVVMATVVLGYTGAPILRGAYVSLRAGVPNMDLLVALAATTAYGYSLLALLLGRTELYFDVAIVIVLAVSIGNYVEDRVKRRAAGRLARLTEERVDEARRRTAEGVETVPLSALAADDEVVVRTGERIPVDGTVTEGSAAVDESLVTGESRPVRRTVGDPVIGGGLVVDGGLVVAVAPGAGSTLERLVALLWDVQSRRSGASRLVDRLSASFVPLVLLVALVAFGGHLLAGTAPTPALLAGLAVLVVSCPCALGLATPLAVAGGVRTALDDGVVVTDASVFERAAATDVVAFDKTGTLTTGRMTLVDDVGDPDALRLAAAVEQFSDHPIADAVGAAVPVPDAVVMDVERFPGRGIGATVDGEGVLVGHLDLFEGRGWTVPDPLRDRFTGERDAGRLPALVGVDGAARSVIVTGDDPRPGWDAVLSDLAATGRRVVVLTGDDSPAADRFRAHPAVSDVFAGVPPEGKVAAIERLRETGDSVAMVGDGSNDAPALAAADLGIALGSGTRLAADGADVVLTSEDLAAVPRVFALTAATRRRVRENLGWAFVYNAVAVPLAVAGLLNPLLAALAMAASSLLVVGNSARRLPVGPRS